MAQLAQTIQAQLTQAAEQDELDLPTLPEVALKIRETAESDDVSVADLAGVIGEDPALAGQIIKISNSAVFRGATPTEDILMAVGRMGVEYAANVATGLAMQHMFQATSDMIDEKLREIWQHAKDVAAISNVLAKSLTPLAADQATLAGLTHSIGALPVLSWVEEHDHLIQDAETLDTVIERVQGPLGTMILQHWHFPEELVRVPEQMRKLDREIESVDYADLVQVANLQSYAGTNHPLSQISWDDVPAIGRIGISPEQAADTLAELKELIDMAREVFG